MENQFYKHFPLHIGSLIPRVSSNFDFWKHSFSIIAYPIKRSLVLISNHLSFVLKTPPYPLHFVGAIPNHYNAHSATINNPSSMELNISNINVKNICGISKIDGVQEAIPYPSSNDEVSNSFFYVQEIYKSTSWAWRKICLWDMGNLTNFIVCLHSVFV